MLINVNPACQCPPCPGWLGCGQLSLPCRAIPGRGTHLLSRATEQRNALIFWQRVWVWEWEGVTQSSSCWILPWSLSQVCKSL